MNIAIISRRLAVYGTDENPILKYIYRYKWKNGIEDSKKAEEYLHLLIAYNVENERIRQSVMKRK